MLTLSQFDYRLPPEKIAQTPVEPRDSCKLLVVNRKDGALEDRVFSDLADILSPDDVLVLNNTKVFPARLFAEQNGKHVELLLEKEIELSSDSITFSALTKPGLKPGDEISIPNTQATAKCVAVDGYLRHLKFNIGREQFFAVLDEWAHTPIPPYIKWNEDDEKILREKYQTVYAEKAGAMAAPTAGLHFTKELLEALKQKNVHIEYVTLHVGLGTFLPVKTENITEHQMHGEWFELDQSTAEHLNEAKAQRKRIIAVGTTVIRVLESSVQNARLTPQTGSTKIFIYPPYQFKFTDALITNFHTPKSTLLMLVSAFVSAPNVLSRPFSDFDSSLMGQSYRHALENNYRLYSFGDAMFIV